MKPTTKSDRGETLNDARLINKRQLKQLIPVSDMTIWRWERDGKLPRRLSIGGRAYWRAAAVLVALTQLAK